MEATTALALTIPILIFLIVLAGRLNLIYKIVKGAVLFGVGYLLIVLVTAMIYPSLAEQLLAPLQALWDIALSLLEELGVC